VVIRQRFLSDFSTISARPDAVATTFSTFRSNSRTRYDPGVQTAIISSTVGRRDVGTTAVISA
jgi:hypothetical protein